MNTIAERSGEGESRFKIPESILRLEELRLTHLQITGATRAVSERRKDLIDTKKRLQVELDQPFTGHTDSTFLPYGSIPRGGKLVVPANLTSPHGAWLKMKNRDQQAVVILEGLIEKCDRELEQLKAQREGDLFHRAKTTMENTLRAWGLDSE